MCSIVGFYVFSDARSDRGELRARLSDAVAVLKTRGPDDEHAIDVGSHCAMGANRLAIRGQLPDHGLVAREGPITVTYNGEIYNYGEWAPEDHWDGACIAPAYLEQGASVFAQFDGEFAIAIHDARTDTLLLARDPFGCRPLYFMLSNGVLFWASHEDALSCFDDLVPAGATSDPSTCPYTLTVQEPYTSWQGVWTVPPGHYLEASRSRARLCPYVHIGDAAAPTTDFEVLATRLERSLVSRLTASEPVAICLSGGVDSGIIAFTADRLQIPYRVFSVTSMFGHPTTEAEWILRRCERLQNALSITLIDCDDAAADQAIRAVYRRGYYASERYDTSVVPTHALYSQMSASGIRVAIDGAGGDELFHGYPFRQIFGPVSGWPRIWSNPYFYSLHTTLLAFTAKTERAGGAFSIEARFPFQSVSVLRAAVGLRPTNTLKWPLRRYLLKRCGYGAALPPDLSGKSGFGVQNFQKATMIKMLKYQWQKDRFPTPAQSRPVAFPFKIGSPLVLSPA